MQRTTKSDCEKKAVERMTHLEQQLSHTETQYHRQLVKLQAEVKALQQAQGDKVSVNKERPSNNVKKPASYSVTHRNTLTQYYTQILGKYEIMLS